MATSRAFGGPLSRIRDDIRSGSFGAAVLLRVGRLAKEKARRAFEEQQRGGDAWPARAVPNVPGILRDAETSSTAKSRRFDPRPAGLDTGSLRNSIQVTTLGKNKIVVGSALSYASRVQQGGPSTITVTEAMRRNVKRMLRDPRAAASPKLRAIASGKVTSVTTNAPARPFLLVTAQDRADYQAVVADEIRRALRGGP